MVLFAEIGPDFWMGAVAGAFGMFVIGVIALNGLAKTAAMSGPTDEEKEKERETYWWNDGKKPTNNEDDE
jgi:hypothetical protein